MLYPAEPLGQVFKRYNSLDITCIKYYNIFGLKINRVSPAKYSFRRLQPAALFGCCDAEVRFDIGVGVGLNLDQVSLQPVAVRPGRQVVNIVGVRLAE
jgi:hypothetical protein